MPTYRARCTNEECNNEQDYNTTISRMNETPACDLCGSETKRTYMPDSHGGTIFKGTGWYKGGAFPGKSKEKK